MADGCAVCEGSGLRIVEEDGRRVARPCECQAERRTSRLLQRAQIPRRYEHCTLANFETNFSGVDVTLKSARMMASRFVGGYPVETDGKGLLLVGPVGVGKTHIAVGSLRALVEERGVKGLFYDYRELLKEVQNSYNPNVAATEMEVLRPVFQAEVLVLDELGASKPTEWVWGYRRAHSQLTVQRSPDHHHYDELPELEAPSRYPRPELGKEEFRTGRRRPGYKRRDTRRPHRRTNEVPAARDVRRRGYVRKRLQGDCEARQLFVILRSIL